MTSSTGTQNSPDASYEAYRRVREALAGPLGAQSGWRPGDPGGYWHEAADSARHLVEASPLLIAGLRRHCGFLSGVGPYDYRAGAAERNRQRYADKLEVLRRLDIAGLFVPEAPELGGFGFEIDGALVNLDTLRLYECLLAMDRGGALVPLRRGDRRPIVLEIGAGWGGLAHALKRQFPETTILVADRPELLLLSATYLTARFPEARVAFLSDAERAPQGAWSDYDFVFLPEALLPGIRPERLDLAVNSLTFQEMTAAEVRRFVTALAELDCPQLYSHNGLGLAPSGPAGETDGMLLDVFEEGYWSNEVALLDGPFTDLEAQPLKEKAGEQAASGQGQVSGVVSGAHRSADLPCRHLVGWKKYRRP